MPTVNQLGSLTREDLHTAWSRVQENAGCAGSDGVTIGRFGGRLERELDQIWDQLMDGQYRPMPLLEIRVEKRPGSEETRTLLIPSVRDRLLQTAVARQLSRVWEEEFLDVSYGYRPGRGVDSAVARVQQWRDRGYAFVVEADITGYFDHLDHTLLLAEYAERESSREYDLLIKAWIRAEEWDGTRIMPLRRGIPQGSPLSPVLANLFLTDFDTEMSQRACRMVRYADDFVLLCRSRSEGEEILSATEAWMTSRKLELKPAKTGIRTFFEGFTFLGVYFHGDQAFRPWKQGKTQGRVRFMAKPMPARLVARYMAPRGVSEMEAAFAVAGYRQLAPGSEYLVDRPAGEEPVAFLYVTEQGAVVRKSSDRFLVEKDGQVLLDLPYHKLESVLLFGGVQVTSQALGEMLEKRITVSFFSRTGRYRGSAVAPLGNDVQLRMAQYALSLDGAATLPLARRLVTAKVGNARRVLARYAARNPERPPGPLVALTEIEQRVGTAESLEVLLGLEGTAARMYFTHVMTYQTSEFTWPGRVKHPSTDPINAMLSLVYTLLWQEFAGILEGLGLDPASGFFHQPDFGRRSLALDLVESFRHPAGDRFVLTVLNKKMFSGDDFFEGPGKAIFLKEDALRRFLELYETWMIQKPAVGIPFREATRRQGESFVRHLQKKAEWEPYIWLVEEDKTCSTSSVTI